MEPVEPEDIRTIPLTGDDPGAAQVHVYAGGTLVRLTLSDDAVRALGRGLAEADGKPPTTTDGDTTP